MKPYYFLPLLLGIASACNKNSIELPPLNVKPVLTTTGVVYNGMKAFDLELERYTYTDSSITYINVRNFTDQQLDSVSVLLYYFRGNSQVYDSIGFLPLVSGIRSATVPQLHVAKLNNIYLPSKTDFIYADILYFKSAILQGNLAAGYYNGFTTEKNSTLAYTQTKGFISAGGQLNLWLKDLTTTYKVNALLPKDTSAVLNAILQDAGGTIATQLSLDTISLNKHFDLGAGRLQLKLKNQDLNANLQSLYFNLIKNF